MRLAVLQSPSPAGDIDAACAAIEAALRAAAALAVDVLTVPEVFLPGYNHADVPGRAIARDAGPIARLKAACRETGCALVMGYAERSEGKVWNSAICIDGTGAEQANYRKLQLYGPREKALYTPGTAHVSFTMNDRKAALLICYDIEFAPHVRALAEAGVQVIFVPTANMMPFTHVPRVTVPAMAANHGVAIAYANYCGTEGDLTYTGGSQITGPHGEVLALAGEGPALLIADLPDPDPRRVSTQLADLRMV
ncbi:MAG: nitrilase-related carbon-nitrogen hydrolase [Tabrizicola sp.]|uniref:nitrilase-related carbon-nitrogen hydrolase n=1 Tax=Tabrizicola sp. TaxID=2005166 RepID=UPI002734F356|nr:nitrilase-related carbon-nitrogen hydrolase [Tabrizicola sp.]MDP3265039.1 nitrilase-related carbon-nitrogen hydrolase [Tabrizicola sp.]MDP3647418.1 nitrilase-related carbon-nitrogen hydrolase [Paracoccaceae bacterium]MDZ4066408.1 nitrilase-related carbon-nitrogen hydrolase [Tabrizicola sp.]